MKYRPNPKGRPQRTLFDPNYRVELTELGRSSITREEIERVKAADQALADRCGK